MAPSVSGSKEITEIRFLAIMPRLSAGPRVLYKGTTGETYRCCASYVTVNRTLLAFAVDRRAAVDMDRSGCAATDP